MAVRSVLGQDGDNDISPAFYRLKTGHQPSNRMASGSWYRLPLSFFEDCDYVDVSGDEEGSSCIGGEIRWGKFRNNLEYAGLAIHVPSIELSRVDEPSIEIDAKKLIVVNCGQGNWNEVHGGKNLLFYDMGASQRYSAQQVKDLISRRFKSLEDKSITVVISHWDLDHFQALRHCSATDCGKMRAVFDPSDMPGTTVYKDAVTRLRSYGVIIQEIKPTRKRLGRRIDLNLLASRAGVDLYRATSGGSRNQTGIVLAIKGGNATALLTGDHHYPKILDAINGKYRDKKLILVAPHHGGNAGDLDTPSWRAQFPQIDCPISVGPNSYKHPNKNIRKLSRLQGCRPFITQVNGDICFRL